MKLNWNERGRGRHMIKKIENFIRENGLLEKGDKILLGLSGGGDSMALLSVFSELKEDLSQAVNELMPEEKKNGKKQEKGIPQTGGER